MWFRVGEKVFLPYDEDCFVVSVFCWLGEGKGERQSIISGSTVQLR